MSCSTHPFVAYTCDDHCRKLLATSATRANVASNQAFLLHLCYYAKSEKRGWNSIDVSLTCLVWATRAWAVPDIHKMLTKRYVLQLVQHVIQISPLHLCFPVSIHTRRGKG